MTKLANFFRKRQKLTVFMAFFLLALVFTYPTLFEAGSKTAFWGSDAYQVIAKVQSQTKTFQENGISGGLVKLAKSHHIHIITPYSIIAQYTNAFFSINLMLWLSFALSGLGAYLLAFYFTKNRMASFLAGLIFAFAPFHLHQSLSINVGSMHQEWIPFFILFLFKFFEKFEFKYFICTAIFAIVIALTEHQLLAFTATFVFIFLIYNLIKDRSLIKNKKLLTYIGASLGGFALLVVGFFLPLLKVVFSGNNYLSAGIGQAERYSMRVLDPIAPPIFHSFWPNVNILIQKALFLGESRERGSYFLSFTVIFLIIYLFAKTWKHRKNPDFRRFIEKWQVKFWAIIFVIFYIFTLGPYKFIFDEIRLYLPYYLVYEYVPFFENIRTTGRFFVIAILAASLLASFGFILFLKIFEKRGYGKKVIFSVFAIIIFLEFSAMPLPTHSIQYSNFYETLGMEQGKFSIIEVPGSTSYEFASFQQITSNVHGKGIFNGMSLARVIPEQFAVQKTMPPFRQLLYRIPKGSSIEKGATSEIIIESYLADSTSILNFYNIRYITLSKQYLNEEQFKKAEDFINKYIDAEEAFEDRFLIAYRVLKARKSSEEIIAALNTESPHWDRDRKDESEGVVYRPADSGAPIIFLNLDDKEREVNISLKLRAEHENRVMMTRDGKQLASLAAKAEWVRYSFAITVPVGKSEAVFEVYDDKGEELFTEKKKSKGVHIGDIKVERVE